MGICGGPLFARRGKIKANMPMASTKIAKYMLVIVNCVSRNVVIATLLKDIKLNNTAPDSMMLLGMWRAGDRASTCCWHNQVYLSTLVIPMYRYYW